MKPIMWLGALLAFLGILGLAMPVFTTSQTRNVAQVGNLKIQSTEQSTHVVAPGFERRRTRLRRRSYRRRTLPGALTVYCAGSNSMFMEAY